MKYCIAVIHMNLYHLNYLSFECCERNFSLFKSICATSQKLLTHRCGVYLTH